ncbi:glycine zipper 2TM domain-containing protein [Sphingopyxis indica]|uniref:glycine zipper 2TM domain-containing protein n=1 Tax=Sphingopyxis indica TaxID=436663 RepID=UPI002938FEBF|nr:glycine zipper 2TM domain-containing protein [Sphingopyxis indica]
MMRLITKSLTGAVAAIGIAATAPAFAGVSVETPAQAYGLHQPEQANQFYHKKHDRRYYASRDERVGPNTRIWRGKNGRYYCKKDNGTTGLLIGGAVGGLAGHEIAGDGDKLLGTIIGAGAGALLGREIDRDKYRCR